MNDKKRLPTAIVLIGILFVSIQFLPRLAFFCFIQVIILFALFEFYNLPIKKKIFLHKTIGILLAIIIGFSFYFDEFSLELGLYVSLVLVGAYFVFSINKLEKLVKFPASIALTFFGAFYLSFTLNYFVFLREERGPFIVYYLIAVIAIADTASYFFGKLVGRHKLAPIASPHKTWEGAFAGLPGACVAAVIIQQILLKDAVLWKVIIIACLIDIVAQISDLLESLFKRAVGVKDSSHMLPGHGGFLDRIDSYILAAPFFYYLLKFIGLE